MDLPNNEIRSSIAGPRQGIYSSPSPRTLESGAPRGGEGGYPPPPRGEGG